MLTREKIAGDWRLWEHKRLAFALEAHLIPPELWEAHVSVPAEAAVHLDDPCAGLGHTDLTGYYVLASAGQGPCVYYIEKEVPNPLAEVCRRCGNHMQTVPQRCEWDGKPCVAKLSP